MAVSSWCDRPESFAELLSCLLGQASAAASPAATINGQIALEGDQARHPGEDEPGRRPAPAMLPAARLVSNPALGHDYVVIPIEKSPENARIQPGTIAGPSDGDIRELILAEQRARENAETERDALADRIAQDFEELHWLRTLALTLCVSDVTTDLETLAQATLPGLCQLVRAEAVALIPAGEHGPGSTEPLTAMRKEPCIVWSGEPPVSSFECLDLVRQFQDLPENRAVVFNRRASLRTTAPVTTARNVLAVALSNGGRHYGWLMALNRVAAAAADRGNECADRCAGEFGSSEVGIMTTAAGMLAAQARNAELFQSEQGLRLGIIETVTGAVDARDPYTCGHSRRVAEMATTTAARLGYSSEQQRLLYITGLMHDVGKIGIRDDILKKPGRLSDEEFEIIKQHPTIGHAILLPLQGLSFVLPGVLHHHERVDGHGYPHGLQGDEIPLDARILAVADSYDAMTSDRAYRPGMPCEKAIAILNDGAGTQWDTSIVEAFLHGSIA
jgi:HD-GYP domain-containing protein (c-di-GMP phosphodiesterase class II)